MHHWWISAILSAVAVAAAMPAGAVEAKLKYNRDIRPILSDNCFRCHGFDKNTREADLRLDTSEGAFAERDGGVMPIVPGKPENSELLRRVTSDDPDERMPPPETHQVLSKAQIETLRRWIAEGAEYEPHWAFIKPQRPEVPKLSASDPRLAPSAFRIANPIDAFIAERLQRGGLSMSPEADKVTLIRRVTLDLIGLPPTPAEVDAFLADTSPDAYEKLVDRLLASPHYGERMALPWLDAARYADSNGFQQDGDTYQYMWRDWVVRALNSNMPFDQFTVEQLAGDLLPDATIEQKLATGLNRCHMLNGEGGAIAEEQRNVVVHDRVDVVSTVWLGLTMTCSQCHDHKYDPLTQKDYYQLFAFFNNVPEAGVPKYITPQYRIDTPWLYIGSPEQQEELKPLVAQLAAAKAEVERVKQLPEVAAAQSAWEAAQSSATSKPPSLEPWYALGPIRDGSFDIAYDAAYDPEREIILDKSYQDGAQRWSPHPEWEDGKSHILPEGGNTTYLFRVIHSEAERPVNLSFGSDDAIKVWFNGVQLLANKTARAAAPDQEKATVTLRAGRNELLIKIVNKAGPAGFYFRMIEANIPAGIASTLKVTPADRSESQRRQLREYYIKTFPPEALTAALTAQATAQQTYDAAQSKLPQVMVMSDDKPRQTHILIRGNYEAPGDPVQADTPAAFPPLPPDAPHNRLSLARWLMSEENPLVARVQVNRYWQLFFGRGLVKTAENFGLQSEQPTEPDLLDWLAVEFRESGWDMKHMHRLIATSATYRQDSRVTKELLERDPENTLYARAPRFRMSSLLLRDVALAASGLLDARMYGKPVYPYQPRDIWDGLAITKERDFTYPQSKGSDLFRRSLYTFWRRTVAPGNMFDASVRNVCKVRPSITCTPLHALTTLNDVTWVEAGRKLAELAMKQSDADPNARLEAAFRHVCARKPTADELVVLRRSLDRALAEYRAKPEAAKAYLAIGDSPRDASLDPAEHAAYATVCLAIFNLDEALTKE
jgi:hypothetical protein